MNIVITALSLTGLFEGALGGSAYALRSGEATLFLPGANSEATLAKYAAVFGLAGMATCGIAGMALTDSFSQLARHSSQRTAAEKCFNSVPAGGTAEFTRNTDGSTICVIK